MTSSRSPLRMARKLPRVLLHEWTRARIYPFVRDLTGRNPPDEWALTTDEHGVSGTKATLLYLIARTLRPETVVETGVWRGPSSRALLAALHDNGSGHLWSIDLPTVGSGRTNADGRWDGTHVGEVSETGRVVPAYLRDRWTLVLGPSAEHLPRLANDLRIDLFVHDSDHTAENMWREYQAVWPAIRPGGVLYSDDIEWNRSFEKFALSVSRRPVTLRLEGGPGYVGGLLK